MEQKLRGCFKDRLKEYTTGGTFLRFLSEAFLQVSVSVAIGFYSPLKTGSDRFQMTFGIWLGLILVIVPAALLFFLVRNRSQLDKRKFRIKYGGLYQSTNTASVWSLAYSSEYMARRLGLALLIAFVHDLSL